MTNPSPAKKLALAAVLSVLSMGFLAAAVCVAAPEGSAVRLAVAPVADGRILAFPDHLPLSVENPEWSLTAQPRGLPELLRRRIVKELSAAEGIEVVEALELGRRPGEKLVRSVAESLRLDVVLVGTLTHGYGQMLVSGYERRSYLGRVRLALTVLSGSSGRPLAPPLILEGSDETEVDFRRPDFETLHHMGAGPEARQRVEEAVREVGRRLRARLSASWLVAALADEGAAVEPASGARLAVERVALEPEEVRSGQTAQMSISYAVSGLAPGAATTVTETRRLLKEGRLVAGPFRTNRSLGNGAHFSVQELHVPADAEAGRYTIIGSVEAVEPALPAQAHSPCWRRDSHPKPSLRRQPGGDGTCMT